MTWEIRFPGVAVQDLDIDELHPACKKRLEGLLKDLERDFEDNPVLYIASGYSKDGEGTVIRLHKGKSGVQPKDSAEPKMIACSSLYVVQNGDNDDRLQLERVPGMRVGTTSGTNYADFEDLPKELQAKFQGIRDQKVKEGQDNFFQIDDGDRQVKIYVGNDINRINTLGRKIEFVEPKNFEGDRVTFDTQANWKLSSS